MVLINLKAVPFIFLFVLLTRNRKLIQASSKSWEGIIVRMQRSFMGTQEGWRNQAAGTGAGPGLARLLSAFLLFLSFSWSSLFRPLFAFLSFLVLLCLVFFVSLFSSRSVSSFVCALSPVSWHLEVCTFVYSLFSPDQLLLNPFLYDIDVHEA